MIAVETDTRQWRRCTPAPAAQRNPLLLLTQNGYFGAAAWLSWQRRTPRTPLKMAKIDCKHMSKIDGKQRQKSTY